MTLAILRGRLEVAYLPELPKPPSPRRGMLPLSGLLLVLILKESSHHSSMCH